VRGVEIHRIDSSKRRGSSRVGFLMAAVVVEMERMDHDGARSIRTIVPHELERWKRRMKTSLWSRKNDRSGRVRREMKRRNGGGSGSNLGPRTPERTSLGMTLEDDEEPRHWSSPWPYSVIDQVFERLTKLSSQLESAVELSSTLQAQHAAVQSTIYALESKVTALEELVHAQSQASCPIEPQPEPAQLPNNPTQSRKSSTNGRSPSKANGL